MAAFTEEDNRALDRIIESRRTVRRFKAESPPKGVIEKVLQAGLQAPYAQISVSREDFRRFVVISRESPVTAKAAALMKSRCQIVAQELSSKLEENSAQKLRGERYLGALRTSGEQGPPNLGKAPYFVVVAEQRGVPDVALHSLAHCLENMWLKATALDLAFQLLSLTERMDEDKEFCDLIGIPFGEYALDGCLIGYPDAAPSPPKRPGLSSVTKWL
jgi:nitroreductase